MQYSLTPHRQFSQVLFFFLINSCLGRPALPPSLRSRVWGEYLHFVVVGETKLYLSTSCLQESLAVWQGTPFLGPASRFTFGCPPFFLFLPPSEELTHGLNELEPQHNNAPLWTVSGACFPEPNNGISFHKRLFIIMTLDHVLKCIYFNASYLNYLVHYFESIFKSK